MEVSASRTSSSLNGLIAAMISFTFIPFCVQQAARLRGQQDEEGSPPRRSTRKRRARHAAKTDFLHIFCTLQGIRLKIRRINNSNHAAALSTSGSIRVILARTAKRGIRRRQQA
jgi:hypothetical protein